MECQIIATIIPFTDKKIIDMNIQYLCKLFRCDTIFIFFIFETKYETSIKRNNRFKKSIAKFRSEFMILETSLNLYQTL